MKSSKDLPFVRCECTQLACPKNCRNRDNPAIAFVDRNGKPVRVCSWCSFPWDKNYRLINMDNIPEQPFKSYDKEGYESILEEVNKFKARS